MTLKEYLIRFVSARLYRQGLRDSELQGVTKGDF